MNRRDFNDLVLTAAITALILALYFATHPILE